MVAYWTYTHEVIGSNPGEVYFFFYAASVVILHYAKNYNAEL